MNKEQFLYSLREKLKGLSEEDIAERLAFYREAIDDRVEDGLTEDEAIAQLGSVDEIAARIKSDIPPTRSARERRKMSALEIVLLVLGSPIWISLLAAAFSVIIALYAVIWSVTVVLWSANLVIAVCAVAGFVGAGVFCFTGSVATGLLVLSAALFCVGLSVFGFFGCSAISKGVWFLTKKSVQWIKALFTRKGDVK